MPAKYYNNLNFTKDDDFNKLFDNTVKINVQLLDKFGTVKAGALYDTELTKKEELQAIKDIIIRTRRTDFPSLDLGDDFIRIQSSPDVVPPRSTDYKIYDGDFVNELAARFETYLFSFLALGETGGSITNQDLYFNMLDGDFGRTRHFVIAGENDRLFLPIKSKTTPNEIEPVGLHPGQFLSGSLENDTLNASAGAILGLKGNDKITGDAGDNLLMGGRGNDIIDGGDGIDTVVFGAPFGAYKYSRLADGSSVFSRTRSDFDREYMDIVKNVEYAQFSDRVVKLPLPVPELPPPAPDNRVTLRFKIDLPLSHPNVASTLPRDRTGDTPEIEIVATFDTPGGNYINPQNNSTSYDSFAIQRATVRVNDQVILTDRIDITKIYVYEGVGVGSGPSAGSHDFSIVVHFPKDTFLYGEPIAKFSLGFIDRDINLFQDTQSFQRADFSKLDYLDYLVAAGPGYDSYLFKYSAGFRPSPADVIPKSAFFIGVVDNPPPFPVNHAPIALDDFADAEINKEVTFAISDLLINDTDLDRHPLSLTGVQDPFNGTVRIEGDKVIFTPKPDYHAGAFSYTISDGNGGTDTASVRIEFDSPPVLDPAAIARDDLADGIQNTPVVIPIATLLSNDIKSGDKPLTLESVSNFREGTVVRDGTNLIFTPNPGSYRGRFDYTVRHEDGTTDTAQVTINLKPADPNVPTNSPPIAADDRAQTLQNEALSLPKADLLANDLDPDRDPLNITGASNAVNGSVQLQGDRILFTPQADFNGDASFDYTISDGKGGTDTATVQIAVNPPPPIPNQSPIAVDDTVETLQNTPIVITPANLLANDSDPDSDPIKLIDVGSGSGGIVEFDGTRITFTPTTANTTGRGSFEYTIADDEGATDSATVNVIVKPRQNPDPPPPPPETTLVNLLPTAPQSTRKDEALIFGTGTNNAIAIDYSDPNKDLIVTLIARSGTLSLGSTDNIDFSEGDGKNDLRVTITGKLAAINRALNGLRFEPNTSFSGDAGLEIWTRESGASNPKQDRDTLTLAVIPPAPAPSVLEHYDGNWFGINSADSQTLKLSLTGQNTNAINELGMFRTDDAAGRIEGIAPGEAGYLEAAMARSRVVMSALSSFSDSIFPNLEPTRHLQVDGGSFWGFYLVRNSTADAVKQEIAGGKMPTNIAFGFASAGDLQVEKGRQDTYTLKFNDGTNNANFDDFKAVLTTTSEPIPLGSNLQDRNQGELIDLRNQTGFQAAKFENLKEASYDNVLGFYAVDNEAGGLGAIAPGDAGYAAAALERRVDRSNGFEGGKLLAPFLIANGTIDEFLATNPENQAGGGLYAYFAYMGANPDRIDHVRLLGNNTFAFEDLYGGGDLDYNDAVIRVDFA